MFGEAIVYGELINIIIDSGSKGSAISKQFLDRKQQIIDEPTIIKLIDIQGNRSSPLGLKKNVQINVEGWDFGIDMIVTESKDYNVLLGNDWISKSRANINYDQGIMTLITPDGTITTPITCWDAIKNPHQYIPIPRTETVFPTELELEEEEEDNGQPFFLNVQVAPGGIQIDNKIYPSECLNYWEQQFQQNAHKTWKGPGKCWCDHTLKEKQKCSECEECWNICETYRIFTNSYEDPCYKIKLEEDDTLLQFDKNDKNKSIAIGEINETQKKQLSDLLQKYAHLFATSKEELGRANVVQHAIYTEEVPPIRQKFYRTSPTEQEHIDKEIQDMLKYNIIRPSTKSE